MKTAPPRIGEAFAEWMAAKNHHKAHAGESTFRFSAVMGCARAAGYYAADLAETDPMDGAALAITAMGDLLHKPVQAAVAARWPTATFEGAGGDDLISGHYDIDDPDADESVEIKTVGAYKFDLSIGLFRSPGRGKKAYLRADGGAGPSLAHICQAGFSASAHGRKNVRIVYISREAVSVKKARDAGLGSIQRFWAEWVFGPNVWQPLVQAEIDRLTLIKSIVGAGQLPDRADFDDTGKLVKVNPDIHWRCDGYCAQATRCRTDGPGRVAIAASKRATP